MSSYYLGKCFPFICLRKNGGVTIYLSTVTNSLSENICRKNKSPTIFPHHCLIILLISYVMVKYNMSTMEMPTYVEISDMHTTCNH